MLAPIALLAVRKRNGAVMLALAAVLSIPWWMNAGARFTMVSLPFLALAMCAAIPRRAILALAGLHAITSWPIAINLYSPDALRLREFPWRAALRIESEEAYLSRTSYDYRYAKMVERSTPPDARILDLWGIHTVHSTREFISSWRSAEAVRLVEGLDIARPQSRSRFTAIRAPFERQPICGYRIVLTSALSVPWTVHQVDVRLGEARVSSRSARLVSSSKMQWEIPLALDRSVVSRWSSGQAGVRGDYLQVEYTEPVNADAIHVLAPASTPVSAAVKIDLCTAGVWKPLPLYSSDAPDLNLRPAAIQLLRQAGITHIVTPAALEGMGVLGERLVNTADDWGLEVADHLYAVYLLKLR
jgi:hypothetical protein